MITSRSNEKIKEIVRLSKDASARREAGLYIVEGPRMVSEVPPELLSEVFVSEGFLKNAGSAGISGAMPSVGSASISGAMPSVGSAGISESMLNVTSDEVFLKISSTKSPQGILALVKMQEHRLSDIAGGKGPVLILEGIQDPGNLGTMFRSGEAAGISGIIADKSCVDAFNPKVVRSTMGAIFRVPYMVADNLGATISEIKNLGHAVYAAHLDGEDFFDEKLPDKCAFLVGNEGAGLSAEIAATANRKVRIPMQGEVESLNAAVSASLLTYEWFRQHR